VNGIVSGDFGDLPGQPTAKIDRLGPQSVNGVVK
jgi:hypothetical protein